jgi:hypothetical protein
MGRFDSLSDATLSTTAGSERVSAFLRSVYGWMCVGLAVTALVALYVSGTNWSMTIARSPWLLLALFGVQLGVVVALSAGVSRLSPGVATLLFLGYSALTGVPFSFLLLVYTGRVDRHDLLHHRRDVRRARDLRHDHLAQPRRLGPVLFMADRRGARVGRRSLLAQRRDAVSHLLRGVIVFTGLTAYDAQRLKAMALAIPEERGHLRHRRRALAIPELRQPVHQHPAPERRPPGLTGLDRLDS